MYIYLFYFIIFTITLFYFNYNFDIIKHLINNKIKIFIKLIINNNELIISIYNKCKLLFNYILILLLHYINKLQYYYIQKFPNDLIFNYYKNIIFINNDLILLDSDSDSNSDSDYSNIEELDTKSNNSDKYIKDWLYSKYIYNNNINHIITNYNLYYKLYHNCNKYNIIYAGLYIENKYVKHYKNLTNIIDIFELMKIHNSLNININITNKLIYLINLSQDININTINKYINLNNNKYLLIYYTTSIINNIENNIDIYKYLKFKIIDTYTYHDYSNNKKLNFGNIIL